MHQYCAFPRIRKELAVSSLKPEGLMARAYVQLRDAVVGGELRPGEPLYEIHLAERLGMSRTPVREALRVLARDGYLEELPSRGYTVPRRSLDDLREFFELREVLESTASRYAALRATDAEIERLGHVCARHEGEQDERKWLEMGHEFHTLVLQAARNSRLQSMLHSLNAQIVISRRTVARADAQRRQAVERDHRAIFEAIRARDHERAQTLAAEHVRRSYETTLRAYQPAVFAAQKAA
jgi:DNA-binding GntR family transcriptional regulator